MIRAKSSSTQLKLNTASPPTPRYHVYPGYWSKQTATFPVDVLARALTYWSKNCLRAGLDWSTWVPHPANNSRPDSAALRPPNGYTSHTAPPVMLKVSWMYCQIDMYDYYCLKHDLHSLCFVQSQHRPDCEISSAAISAAVISPTAVFSPSVISYSSNRVGSFRGSRVCMVSCVPYKIWWCVVGFGIHWVFIRLWAHDVTECRRLAPLLPLLQMLTLPYLPLLLSQTLLSIKSAAISTGADVVPNATVSATTAVVIANIVASPTANTAAAMVNAAILAGNTLLSWMFFLPSSCYCDCCDLRYWCCQTHLFKRIVVQQTF